MIVARSTFLPCPFERCLEEVVTSRLLQYVASPLVAFVPVSPPALPERWEEEVCRAAAAFRPHPLRPPDHQYLSAVAQRFVH
jgi:hypothetical protein